MKYLALAALVLAGCSQSPQHTAEQMEYAVKLPTGQTIVPSEEQLATMLSVEVVSLSCDTYTNFGLVKGVVRNTGKAPIRSADVFVKIDGQMHTAPVLTFPLPPGAMGEFSVGLGGINPPAECDVVAVQDRHGRQLL